MTTTFQVNPAAARTAAQLPADSARRPRAVAALARRYGQQRARREVRRDVLTVAAWMLVATSIALFLADHGTAYFATFGGAVTAIGIITGLVATALMCLMLVLSARVPIIDRTLGQDRATSLHATLGRGMVLGLLVHGVFLVLGYSLTGVITPLATFVGLWTSSADFIWACLAFVLFAVVGISSMVAVRRRYPYETWFAIHLTSYAAILASLPHQFSMSGILAPGTFGRTFWILMWLATAWTMLAYRVFAPIISSFTHRLTVSSVVPVGPDAVSISFTGRNLLKLEARGGHWFQWRFLTPGLVLQPHPFSLSADPTDSTMRVTVRNLGAGTSRLQALRPGTRVAIEGPYGMFTDEARTTEKVVLVGAGIGIAPVRALLEATEIVPGQAAVILRAHTPEELYLADEVARLCRDKGADLHVLVGPRAGDTWVPQGYAGAHLTDFAPWAASADLFVCGPTPWMRAVLADAEACGIPEEQIHDELFAW